MRVLTGDTVLFCEPKRNEGRTVVSVNGCWLRDSQMFTGIAILTLKSPTKSTLQLGLSCSSAISFPKHWLRSFAEICGKEGFCKNLHVNITINIFLWSHFAQKCWLRMTLWDIKLGQFWVESWVVLLPTPLPSREVSEIVEKQDKSLRQEFYVPSGPLGHKM